MTNDIVARLRESDGGYFMRQMFTEAADEIERLREALRIEQEELAACCIDRRETQRERDEARRQILDSMHPEFRKGYTAARGWECFKENTDDR